MIDFEILVSGYQFVEAPRLDSNDTLYFSDLTGGGVHRRTSGGAIAAILPDRQWVGGIVINDDGRLICSGKGGLVLHDPQNGSTIDLLATLDGEPLIAVNDIEAAPDGGLFGGSVDFAAILERGETPLPGKLFHLAPDGRTTIFRDDVFASNGIGYSPDGRTLYHSETSVGVWAWDLAPDCTLSKPRILAKLDDSDGLVVDREGGIWVARWEKGEVLRFNPDGKRDRSVALPFPNTISLDFGGPDDRWLHVSTGGVLDDGTIVGGVIRFDTGLPGQRGGRSRFSLR